MPTDLLILIVLVTAAVVTAALVRRDHPRRARSLRWALYSCAGAIACTVVGTIVVGNTSRVFDPDEVERIANIQIVMRAFALAFVANGLVMLAVGLDLPDAVQTKSTESKPSSNENPSFRGLYYEQRRENRRLRTQLEDLEARAWDAEEASQANDHGNEEDSR